MKGLEVIKAGIFTLIQDSGRYGYTNRGITQSGAMDEYSYHCLNKLLENTKGTNSLEIVFGNIELRSSIDTYFCITGALCELFINGEEKENWKVHRVKIGDIIKIAKIIKGQRVYLGVKGGFDIPKELGSNSTTLKESIGGIRGEKLNNGDLLGCVEHKDGLLAKLQDRYIPKFKDEIVLRVVLGYQYKKFPKIQRDKFFSKSYEITPAFDRMGCKLKGEAVNCDINGIISEAVSYGAIQIPADGQPIILLKDRQTIGGYPKIGSVIPYDCYMLAQMRAGGRIRFKELTMKEALILTKDLYTL